ncbi:metallophosphoesterase [Desulfobacula sp.]|uniref:metallophosphoesterase family protein n=1 Tax=Desulfobacula sp. TaxID=2593537 RepID=UPI002605857C|nr:metallophosphoesterase [Desulfobacula sp.]
MIKVLHTADWHYRDNDHDEIEKCVDAMISSAREEQPDVIIIAGDITDSQNLKLDSRSAKTICRQVSELADIAPVAIIIGTPSHDGKSAEILRFIKGKHSIHVSEKPEQLCLSGGGLYTEGSGLSDKLIEAVITQIPTPTKQYFQSEFSIAESDREIANALSTLLGAFGATASQFNCPHILSGHFQMGGAFISETQQLVGRDIEVSTDQIAMANAHVVCLGHIHKQQEMKENVFYSGSIWRQNFGEMEDKGFYYHDLCMNTPSRLYDSTFVQVPTRKLLKIFENFIHADIQDLDMVIQTYGPEDIEGAYIKIEFKVWQDESGKINQAELERSFLEAGALKVDINLIRVPRETVRCAKVLQLNTLREKVSEMASLRLEEISEEILVKADLLENVNEDDLMKVVGRVN